MRDKQPCVDKLSTCRRLVAKFMGGRCPDANHESIYLDYMKDHCPATCGHCDCPTKVCQNGGKLNACVCKCVGGWIGADCAVCPITKCKHGGTFDASTCSCHCSKPNGGLDCGCADSKENFNNRGRHWWRCSLAWLLTKRICCSPFFGPSLRKNCPVSCR
ncbi:hypothetical protein NP493_1914g00011 [Ridgeia piscesae]|uniref:ShKT domain-containing protein n=1 Tax=Ridgeia piscesae TaxID=27915 RepID=A0AAD9JQJ1_RIDPI|nr:hypothetical protein NP493_1914g00011 [Ridgeia piscesae]